MPGVLVSIDAWDRISLTRVTVRVGSARNAKTLGADGYVWEPGLPRRPRFSMQFVDDDLTGVLMAGSAELVVDTNKITGVDPARLDFVGAPVRMYYGDSTSLSSLYQVFVGKVNSGTADATTGMLPLQCEVNRSYFDVPLLNLTYGGGGGADGDPEIRGTNKPAGFGAPINIRPVLVNADLAIYQVDGYANTLTIPEVFEDLASFGAPHANYANYAALAAATIPEGRFATCIAEGMFRLGADAAGTITCDATFGSNRPGSMMLRWLQTHAGLSSGFIRTSDFDALTTAVAGVAGHQTPVSYWTQETGNVLDLIQRMCASCNAVPLLMLDGTIGISRVSGGAQELELRRRGGDPLVTAWQAADSPVPWWRLRMAAEKSFYVNSPAEIDYEDDIRDMGDYLSGETYRQGMVVRSTTDGARYIYINATATSGNAPPNATYWDLYEVAPDATTIKYPGGATLASKEPQEAGANVTETRTAASIVAQGAFATISTAAYGSSLLTGFGSLAPLSQLLLGSTYLRRSDGTTLLTDSTVVTALGIAASIAGQGPGATATALQVMNNQLESSLLRVPSPGGGAYSYSNPISGMLKVRLPVGFTNTMVRFRIEIINFALGTSITYEVGGYTSSVAGWTNPFASMIGPDSMRREVRFGADGAGYASVWIGSAAATDVWQYPQVRIIDFQAGYSAFSESSWATGWVVSIGANDIAVNHVTVAGPNAGEARYGLNVLESPGVAATLSNFKTALGTASSITGQGTFATVSNISSSNVGTYFNFNAFRLDYSITRSDGTTVVTEALAITSLGISAGFTGQGSMATQNASNVSIVGGSIDINGLFTVAADGTTTIKSAATGQRTEVKGTGVRTYDSAGNWTTKLGDLS